MPAVRRPGRGAALGALARAGLLPLAAMARPSPQQIRAAARPAVIGTMQVPVGSPGAGALIQRLAADRETVLPFEPSAART
jgi:hypothetical protein